MAKRIEELIQQARGESEDGQGVYVGAGTLLLILLIVVLLLYL